MSRAHTNASSGTARFRDRRAILGLLGIMPLAAGGVCAQATPARPIFQDGQAQVVPTFADPALWIRHDLWVETEFDSDGDGRPDRMHVGVTRQAQTESEGLRVPVVYETSPYFAGVGSTATQFFWDVRQELGDPPPPRARMPEIPPRSLRPIISNANVGEWVPRGFAVVHSESPGTGLSQGCPTIGGRNESLAPKAVIDWLNGRARGFDAPEGGSVVTAFWSTGRVGMTGTSYNGTLPIAAASTGVEGLEAIIPLSANTSYYEYYRANGLVRSPGGYLGEDVDVLFDFVHSGDPRKREYCVRAVREADLAAGQDRRTGDYNDFWAGRDYLTQLSGIRAPTLLSHGLADWNVMPGHSVRVYEALRQRGVTAQLYLHQGGHGGRPPLEMMNRWFTRFLYDVENGVERDPRSWVVREDARRGEATAYAEYPHPEAAPVTLRLGLGGGAVGALSPRAGLRHGVESLTDDVSQSGAELARAGSSGNRLLYATEELVAPVHLSGTPRVSVRLASSRPAANLSVWLVTLPWVDAPGSAANLVTRGWADPQNHASRSRGEPLVPGRFYDVTFALEPDDQIIPAGRRLALMIFSSDREFTLWPRPGTELRIDLAGTTIELPVVGGAPALDAALP